MGARVIFTSLVVVLLGAAVAHAQLPVSPYEVAERQAKDGDLDTDVTPVAKDSKLWSLVAGARFGETEVVEESATSFDTDLFAVSFANRTAGLAGGSACRSPVERQTGEEDAEFGRRASACESSGGVKDDRVPTLYRYREVRGEDPSWERLELPGQSKPGYIGAIAWIDRNRALVAGGTGTYPRRDLGWDDEDRFGRSNAIDDPTDPDKADPAGKARVWLYERSTGALSALDLSELTEDEPDRAGMRGITAADCYDEQDVVPGEKMIELCFVGGLGQIWEWRDGAFTGKRVDAQSAEEEISDATHFRYRVRDIETYGSDRPRAYAVTAGCCGPDELRNKPRLLTYDEEPFSRPPRSWTVRSETYFYRDTAIARSNPCVNTNQASACLKDLSPQADDAYKGTTAPGADKADSYYAVTTGGGNTPYVVAAPGGPEQPHEPPSERTVSTSRLVASDGDVAQNNPLSTSTPIWWPDAGQRSPDGEPDWVVGELRSTRIEGLGARGLLVAETLAPPLRSALNAWVVTSGSGIGAIQATAYPTPEDLIGGWEPIDQEKLDPYVRSPDYLLPSYSVNAIEIVGAEEDGWAVGDRGAILHLDVAQSQRQSGAGELEPPRLGSGRTSRDPASAYDGTRPQLPSKAGVVPPLGEETIELDEPQMLPYGALRGETDQIIMSRDASEGWAIGTASGSAVSSFGRTPTLHRYTSGGGWEYCDPIGIKGLVEPDPACKAIAPLFGYRNSSGGLATARIIAATRVPLENDDDATNDDELEIIAIGERYSGPETDGKTMPAVLRYRDGRWSFEDPKVIEALGTDVDDLYGVAFAAPDDGWIIERPGPPAFVTRASHFDGERWIDCVVEPSKCGDLGRVKADDRSWEGLISAGDRVYLYGSRRIGGGTGLENQVDTGRAVPIIIYRERNGQWTDGSGPGEDGSGFDPAFTNPATEEEGRVLSLSIVKRPDGRYEGWAVGRFGAGSGADTLRTLTSLPAQVALMRLDPEQGGGWRQFRSPGAFEDYMTPRLLFGALGMTPDSRRQVTYPSSADPDGAFIGQAKPTNGTPSGRIFGFDSSRQRFEMLDTGRPQGDFNVALSQASPHGSPLAMAPDGSGGFWAGVAPRTRAGFMYRWTDQPPKPVFEEVANPLGARDRKLTAVTGALDGSVWATSDSNAVFRHDRQLGWEQIRIPGWDPGRVVTRPSRAEAIAIGPDGEGIVVGERGRVANLLSDEVTLDPAAGRSCALGQAPPCSTSRDLKAVDIAPNGAALAGGRGLSLLWRPPGGDFREIEKPPIASSTTVTGISYPTGDRAFLATDRGRVFRGDLSGGSWSWEVENQDDDGTLFSRDASGNTLAVSDVAVDASGHGYAVGDGGLILRRRADGRWERIAASTSVDLTEVELPEPGGDGALIGGDGGLILTAEGPRVAVARYDDWEDLTGPVVGFAYHPGASDGSVDAWAGLGPSPEGGADSRLLRHSSGSDEPVLAGGMAPLADAPPKESGELAIAAFGKSDCDFPDQELCPEMTATTTTNELAGARVADELAVRRSNDSVDLAVLTGDATDSASLHTSSVGNYDRAKSFVAPSDTHLAGQLKHRRYAEEIVNELEEDGLPVFGAMGGQDLSESVVCDTGRCHSNKALAPAGENLAWREAFAGRTEPWGSGEDEVDPEDAPDSGTGDGDAGNAPRSDYEFIPVRGSDDGSIRIEDQGADPDGEGPAPEANAAIGGANTHYAVEAIRDGERVARIVFVDTSMRSLQASDALQQPQEPLGGQARFLERMICKEGGTTSTGDECTRGKDQAAIVVSNTPTYSYGPGALTHTATDANVFEALMLRHDVDLVISGALGYNGLYYTLAPGIHEPCPGGEHPEGPPKGGLPSCAAGTDALTAPLEDQGVSDPRKLLEAQGLSGAVPTLIAAGAGGKFGPDGQQQADGPAGQWHGYSIARLRSNGELIVEQRPILDWIGMDAEERTVFARAKVQLRGYGRSPVSTATEGMAVRAFHYDISNAAITHRYDLLLADPDQPWLPCDADDPDCRALHAKLSVAPGEPVPTSQLASAEEPANASAAESDSASQPHNPCAPYLCLPKRIGTVDRLSGEVKAGDGKYPETFAIAMLSVHDKVATYPLVFKPSPSFVVTPFEGPPQIPANASPAAPPPPTLPKPQIPSLTIPQPPTLPAIPPLVAQAPPEPQPPAPPAPPPPAEQPSPLNLSVAPTGLTVATPTAVIQPPTPPVNPAPPGGARREARQRQAAAQKSGADNAEEGSETQNLGGDLAQRDQAPEGSAMRRHQPNAATRRAAGRTAASFTPRSQHDQPSAWARGTLYGGGLTLLAFALAAGWTRGRPTPRRRQPELPAPAFSRRGPRRS